MNEVELTIGQILGAVLSGILLLGGGAILIATFLCFIIDPQNTVDFFRDLFEEWIDNWKAFLHKD